MNRTIGKVTLLSALLSLSTLMSPILLAKDNGNYLHQKIEKMQVEGSNFKEFNLFKKISDTEKSVVELQRMRNELLATKHEQNMNSALTNSSRLSESNIDKLKKIADSEHTFDPLLAAEFLTINSVNLQKLKKTSPQALTMSVPFKHQTNNGLTDFVKVKLFKRELYTKDAKFIFQDKQTGVSKKVAANKLDLGVHYHGVVEGESQSIVALSIYNDSIEGRIHSSTLGDLNLGKLKDKNHRLKLSKNKLADSHILYRVNNLDNKRSKHNCKMDGHNIDTYLSNMQTSLNGQLTRPALIKDEFLSAMSNSPAVSPAALNDYYFTTYTVISGNLASDIGSAFISNWIGSVLNQVAAVYNVDGLLFYSEGWKSYTNSPVYDGQKGAYLLEQFAYYDEASVKNSDVGMLLTSTRTSANKGGGLAYKIGGVCSYKVVDGLSYSPMDVAYSYFPTYSWTVDVYAHEAGHTLGSPHTHNCSWNGNNTAIDSCSGFTEGSCPLPGNPAWGQGTVMSYCSGSVGKNPGLGFANQPAAKIANHVWYCADR